MSLVKTLTEVFNTNFVSYTQSHIAHLNIVGRNFYSDHKLLQKVYETLQADVDTIGEFLRTLNAMAPESLADITDGSKIEDDIVFGDADELLGLVLRNLTTQVTLYRELEEVAEEEEEDQISNFAQDRISALEKFSWMLRSTLD